MFHATEATQGLLQNPMAGMPLHLRKETHATGILFTSHSLGRSAVAVWPGGAGEVSHDLEKSRADPALDATSNTGQFRILRIGHPG